MRKWIPLVAICLGSLLFLIDTTAVTVALPDIGRSFAAPLSGLQWVLTVYTLVLAVLMLPAGSIADRYGHRKVYLAGLGVFLAASFVCGVAPGIEVLIAARGVQAVGGAAMAVTTFALIGSCYSGRDRGVAMGIWGAVNGLAAAAGPMLGGVLTQFWSWRAIFLINLPLVVLTVVATLRIRSADGNRDKKFDLFGLIGLFRGSSFNAIMVCTGVSASVFACLVYSSVWLQSTLGLGPVRAGLALVPLALSIFVTSTLAGRLLHDVTPRIMISAGLLLAGAGCALQAGLDESSTTVSILAGLVVTGVGVGLVMPSMGGALLGSVAPERFGIAVGAMTTCRQLGQSVGVAVLGLVYESGVSPADGLNLVYLTAAVAGFVSSVLGFLLIRKTVGAGV
ncbi:MFS family permease [Kibdelosporangium banguiense]|uniref:MFS family permease n=1 Tax=Kibdelosporangium banguiense TaxID=1365924 RepID=A0ABS4TT76_9PSEU|nr:MFS transporter [Kibdelosporangium banguiense]MBP2327602.1 MFS family permease [Kibdelosporangium banguiense]